MRPWMMVTGIGILLTFGGCKGEGSPDPSSQAPAAATDATAGDEGPEPEPPATSHACEDDRDCVVNCDNPGDCCGPLCGCDQVVHRELAEANRKARRKKCDGKELDCPVASCARPSSDVIPRCIDAACVAQTVPRYYADQKYTCESDEDCVVTTTLPNDCCGQLCFPTAVYHEDELAAIEAVNAERCTDADRDRCPLAECEKPTTSVQATCVDGRCTGKDGP